jgi:hypothetical protein
MQYCCIKKYYCNFVALSKGYEADKTYEKYTVYAVAFLFASMFFLNIKYYE